MRIAFSYCSNGLGHKVQSSLVINKLRELGHEVLVVTDIPKLVTVVKKNELVDCYYDFKNLNLNKTEKTVNDFKPDYIFTDFEPWLNAYGGKNKLPTISIDTQKALENKIINDPKYYSLVQECNKYSAKWINLHFFNSHFGPISTIKKEVDIILNKTFLVYLTWDGAIDIEYFCSDKFKGYEPCFFSSELLNNPDKYTEFLRTCDFVVTNGGHGIISDALISNKPLFLIPVKNHTEKKLNCDIVKSYGYGSDDLEEFFKEKNIYKLHIKNRNLQPANLENVISYALGK